MQMTWHLTSFPLLEGMQLASRGNILIWSGELTIKQYHNNQIESK
jgi:hypothetical protein